MTTQTKHEQRPRDTGHDPLIDRVSTAREWLRAYGHDDIADIIDGIMARWARDGIKTRRNWWEILAGDRHGRPRRAGGLEIPVLAAAQARMGRPITKNARRGGYRREIPPIRIGGRWQSGE